MGRNASCLLLLACGLPLLALANDVIHVQLTQTALCDPVPSDFVSFSIEVERTVEVLEWPPGSRSPRPSWANLMNNLRTAATGGLTGKGPNIRVGGYSSDISAFIPSPLPLPSPITYRVTPDDFAVYVSTVPAWNGSVTLGLNFDNGSNPALALAHAAAALDYVSPAGVPLAPLLEQFEVGNEPDLYVDNKLRAQGWNYDVYVGQFGVYLDALAKVAGPRRVQGGTYCCLKSYFAGGPSYVKGFAGPMGSMSMHRYALCARPLLMLLCLIPLCQCMHRYPMCDCHGSVPTPSMMLSDSSSADQRVWVAATAASAAAAGIPVCVRVLVCVR